MNGTGAPVYYVVERFVEFCQRHGVELAMEDTGPEGQDLWEPLNRQRTDDMVRRFIEEGGA